MNLTDKNIELYLFRYKEGLLDAAETAEVERALKERPDWQELADLYDPELTLPAGATMHYNDYETLRDGGPKAANIERKPIVLREGNPQRRRLMPLWTTVAAAACLLLFVTTIIKFTGENLESNTLVAKIMPDTATQYYNDNTTDVQTQEMHIESTVRQTVRHNRPLLLTEACVQPDNATENIEQTIETPALATPSDSSVYDLDIPTLREVNDPMDQDILYANIIDWRTGNDEAAATPSHRQPLRSIARKATSIIATATSGYEESRENVESALEEKIQSNQFVNSLIATLE